MLFTEIISKKRDGQALSQSDIEFFVTGLANGSISSEQVAALAMAIYLRSMDATEAAALTRQMAASGRILEWSDSNLGGPVVDKHSTGGIGDKVSLPLAAIAAACGCFVPMISGRGLGHTGGTLDKMDSIPGYCATPSLDRFRQVVRDVGCAIIGQTAELAPADRRLYAIRDVTATVESVPLITASILSKKIAAGNQGLVLDVKVGSGAFMSNLERAGELAASVVATANQAGLTTHALISDMNETLGSTAGNALEVSESVAYLLGKDTEPRFDELTMSLAAQMLVLSDLANDAKDAHARARQALTSGKAAEIFARMITELGGPADFLQRPDAYLPTAPVLRPVLPGVAGYLCNVDARAIGHAIIELGGGRRLAGDELDLSVGFSGIARIGEWVDNERPLAIVHAASVAAAEAASAALRRACVVADNPPASRALIYATLTADSLTSNKSSSS